MMNAVKSRRIASGGYVSGETTKIESSYYEAEPIIEAVEPYEEVKIDYEAELVARVEAAHREIFEAGYQKGLAEGRSQIAAEGVLLKKLLTEIESGIDTVWDSCRAGVAKLGLQIGGRIVGEAARNHEALALDLAKRGVLLAREQTDVTIFVNPADLAALQAAQIDILSAAEGVRRIEIRAKGSVAPGGVLIECELGTFDLRPEVQLEAMEKALEIEPDAPISFPVDETDEASVIPTKVGIQASQTHSQC